jgi:hypothetical protein
MEGIHFHKPKPHGNEERNPVEISAGQRQS